MSKDSSFDELWNKTFQNVDHGKIEPDHRHESHVEKILTKTLLDLMTREPNSIQLVEPYYRLAKQFFEITDAVDPDNLNPRVFIAAMKQAYNREDKLSFDSNQEDALPLTNEERNAFNNQRKQLLENLLSKTENPDQQGLIRILIGSDDQESNIMTKLIKFACDHPKDKQDMSNFTGLMDSLINAGTELPNLTRLFNLNS